MDKAKRQIEHAYNVITHVKEDVLTPEQLKIHNATLVLMADLCQVPKYKTGDDT